MDKETIVQLLSDGVISNEVAAKYFPELKEIGDEKVKEELIKAINLAYDCGIAITKENRDKYLAWIEKQGENSPILINSSNIGKNEQKPAWSEVDKDFMYDTLSNLTELKDRYGDEYGNVGKCIDWVKSLKERYTWKPSDKQMELLKEACDQHWEPDGLDPLYTLYQDLKKLKEE